MASEKGHAKNIANANLLNTQIIAIGKTYNPSNTKLLLNNLQSIYTKSFAEQEKVNTLLAPYANAVNNRESIFAPLTKQISKLRKAFKASDGITQALLEDFMTVARKLKGVRKIKNLPTADTTEEKAQHSTSQLSFDQRTNNIDLLISLLKNTPNYNPNEPEYQVQTFQSQKNQMLETTQAVAKAFVPLSNARSKRNDLLYNSNDNLVDTFNKAKDYLFTILDSNSEQYKEISRIKFKNR